MTPEIAHKAVKTIFSLHSTLLIRILANNNSSIHQFINSSIHSQLLVSDHVIFSHFVKHPSNKQLQTSFSLSSSTAVLEKPNEHFPAIGDVACSIPSRGDELGTPE